VRSGLRRKPAWNDLWHTVVIAVMLALNALQYAA
jgi:hypothetical protein